MGKFDPIDMLNQVHGAAEELQKKADQKLFLVRSRAGKLEMDRSWKIHNSQYYLEE